MSCQSATYPEYNVCSAAAGSGRDAGGFVAAFSGSHRYIMDYLSDEVLSRQPQEIQEFLLRTSILERMNGALCEMV